MLITDARLGEVLVTPPVEIDVATGAGFARQIAQACALHPDRVSIDFAGVTFCDSTAVSVMLSAIEDLTDQGCVLVVKNPCRQLRTISQVLHLPDTLGIPPQPSSHPSVA